ncbi:MAG: ParA family protein [Candidatus Kariarchaeaceae archaeon]|jgi:MinD-like ATPase involved in chromosome partitioning or flagellar assembly
MATSIAIHSHKGGTGKTLVAMNLATLLAKKGKRVVVLDLDLNAPSLQTYAPNRNESTINDMFLNNADAEDVIFDATYLIGEEVPGRLYLGLADISGDIISQMGQRDKDALLKDLYVLMGLIRNKLPSHPWNADYILLDTPPGLSTTSINGVAATEQLILILRIVNADIDGTKHFLHTIHKALRPKTHIIVNQVPSEFVDNEGTSKTSELIDNRIIKPINSPNITFGGIIKTDSDLIQKELEYAFDDLTNETEEKPRPIHLMDPANHKFSVNFEEVVNNILGI